MSNALKHIAAGVLLLALGAAAVPATLPAGHTLAPGAVKEQPWGHCTCRAGAPGAPTQLYLHVSRWHAGGRLPVYGLASTVKRAYFPNREGEPLKAEKVGRWSWIDVGKKAPEGAEPVVVLE